MKDSIEKIRCDELDCTTVVAERRADGTIIIRARHHGEMHVTIIPPGCVSQNGHLPVEISVENKKHGSFLDAP